MQCRHCENKERTISLVGDITLLKWGPAVKISSCFSNMREYSLGNNEIVFFGK